MGIKYCVLVHLFYALSRSKEREANGTNFNPLSITAVTNLALIGYDPFGQ